MYEIKNNSSVTCSFIEVNANKPIEGILKDFHSGATFTVKLKPGDLVVQKYCPLDATMRLAFVVGSADREFITIYPRYFSTFEDAILEGFILKVKLNELTKSFWI